MNRAVLILSVLLLCLACKDQKQGKRSAKGYTKGAGQTQRNIESRDAVREQLAERKANDFLKKFILKYGRSPQDTEEFLDFAGDDLPRLSGGIDYYYDPDKKVIVVEGEE